MIQPLADYSYKRIASDESDCASKSSQEHATTANTDVSVLFLQIEAAADYFTLNKTLMQHPPPVVVDIILDPFILNVLPRSLLPTGAYLLVVAVASWFVSGALWKFVSGLGAQAPAKEHVQ